MKLNFNWKNKEASFETDVEGIIEKRMNQHSENGLNNFKEKQTEKRKMLDLKHKQKLEIEQEKQKRKSWSERRIEAKMKKKQLELELEKQKRKEDIKQLIMGISIMIGCLVIILIICSLGERGIL